MPLPGNANLGREKCNQNCEIAVPVLGPFFGPRLFYRPYMIFQFLGPKKVPKTGPQSDDGHVCVFGFFLLRTLVATSAQLPASWVLMDLRVADQFCMKGSSKPHKKVNTIAPSLGPPDSNTDPRTQDQLVQ